MTDQHRPTPKPGPRPGPHPGPRPSAVAPAAKPEARDRSAELAAATEFGRVGDDRTVFVRTADGERAVGQYPDADERGALEYFAKKYLDLVDAAALLRQRLEAGAAPDAIRRSAAAQREALPTAEVVGDLAGLHAQLDRISEAADAAAVVHREHQDAQREEGRKAREAVVEEAEQIAGRDPAQVQWKQSTARMRELFDQWKAVQSNFPKLPRSVDQELWGRFSTARKAFDRARREFFSHLDAEHAEGKRLKEKLVAEAEALSNSTDWRDTSAKYRDLMARWKATPRAARKDDDALWARFRAAQDVFFAARKADNDAIDASYAENLVVKEKLLEQAQALLPITDVTTAKDRLRTLQDQWEDAGRVPRADISRMENGLRAVEQAVADAEAEQWRKSDPTTKARTSGVLAQLDEQLAKLRADVETARASGDDKRLAQAQEALATKEAWYRQLTATQAEFDG